MSDIVIRHLPPAAIEAESFRIIDGELGDTGLAAGEHAVLIRAIHASGDLGLAAGVRFHPGAVAAGIAAIRAGRDILVDVAMVAAGINATLLARWGGRVVCLLHQEDVAAQARQEGRTRTETAIGRGIAAGPGIVAIGNAPTALLRAMEILDKEDAPAVGLLVGVPVGFVNAAESKALLATKAYPFITLLGRKGGSPVAAAMVNALLRLAAA